MNTLPLTVTTTVVTPKDLVHGTPVLITDEQGADHLANALLDLPREGLQPSARVQQERLRVLKSEAHQDWVASTKTGELELDLEPDTELLVATGVRTTLRGRLERSAELASMLFDLEGVEEQYQEYEERDIQLGEDDLTPEEQEMERIANLERCSLDPEYCIVGAELVNGDTRIDLAQALDELHHVGCMLRTRSDGLYQPTQVRLTLHRLVGPVVLEGELEVEQGSATSPVKLHVGGQNLLDLIGAREQVRLDIEVL